MLTRLASKALAALVSVTVGIYLQTQTLTVLLAAHGSVNVTYFFLKVSVHAVPSVYASMSLAK